MAEKAARLKLLADDPAGGPLRRLESVEAVAVGIEGKRALWQALAAVAEGEAKYQGHDYDALVRRAADQRERVERLRLEAAREALVL